MDRLRDRIAIFRKNATYARDVIYAGMGARWSVNPFVYAWRTRYLSIELVTQMGLWVSQDPAMFDIDINDPVREWRGSSTVANVVTRNIILLAVKRDHFTTADVEVACGVLAKRTTIKKLLSTGVELGLLTQDSKWNYRGTKRLIKTSFWRTLVKLLDPNIVRFARYVVMWDEMRKAAEQVGELESRYPYKGSYRSLHEQLFYGEFDAEIFDDDGFDHYFESRNKDIPETLPFERKTRV